MKIFKLLAVLIVSVHLSRPQNEEDRRNGENGWYMLDENSVWQWFPLNETEQWLDYLEKLADELHMFIDPVSYHLYTASNPTQDQVVNASTNSIDASNFNVKHPTRFVIHGWGQGYTDNTDIRDAWLSLGDYNVIYVNWPRAHSLDYISSVIAVPGAGRQVGEMIDFLNANYGMHMDDLIVAGHSLGSHVAGYAGKNVKHGRIRSIIALDPALPLFSYENTNKRLADGDATYVESIQTDGGHFGFLRPIGQSSFYVNGGRSQPGCDSQNLASSCDHQRSVIYYAEAIRLNDFPSIKCRNYEDALENKCGTSFSSVRMGDVNNADKQVEGSFYVPTHSSSPYGYGSQNN